MRIRSKLILTYVGLAMVALIAISSINYFYTKQAISEHVHNHLESVASIQKNRLEGIINQNLERLRLVSSRTQLRISFSRYRVDQNSNDKTKLVDILNDALASISDFKVISIVDTDGKIVVSTRPEISGRMLANENHFTRGLIGDHADTLFLDSNNHLSLYLSGPLVLDGEILGVLVIESSVNNIVDSLSDYSGLGNTGESLLAKISPDAKQAQYLLPLRFNPNAALQESIDLGNQDQLIVRALTVKNGFVTGALDYRNQPVLAVVRTIESTGWIMAVKIDVQEAFSAIENIIKFMVFATLLSAGIIVIVSVPMAYNLSMPIIRLTDIAGAISRGQRDLRAQINGVDEIKALATAFNIMTEETEEANRSLELHRDHLEDLVAERTHKLEIINAELESFSYSVSHDLRSPLRSIDGFSQILLEDYEDIIDANGQDYLRRVRAAAQRMGTLIDDMLNLSRVSRTELKIKEIDISSLVARIINQLKILHPETHATFTVEPDLHVRADEKLIEIALTNLLDNARKYSSKSGNSEISFGKDDRNRFYVSDNGVGFDMEYYDKLFNTFQRLHTNREFEGTGIGLATAARVIHRHGGEVSAEGEVGKGACFYFSLPD